MRHFVPVSIAALLFAACGSQKPAPESVAQQEGSAPLASETSPQTTDESASGAEEEGAPSDVTPDKPLEFVVQEPSEKGSKGEKKEDAHPSKIKPTKTEAALKFTVVNKDTGAIPGIVIVLTAPNGKKYYTEETDAQGYAEVLVPVGQKYDVVYLSLGRRDIAAALPVGDEPNQNIRLTLRYKRWVPPQATTSSGPSFVLDGVNFDTGKATIRPDSLPRFDSVIEYMMHKQSARIEISGHTDNVGNAKTNKALSEKRAKACKDYLVSKGIEANRIEAVGYGDERPIASNDTEEGRQQNRRIEATEL